MARKPRRGPDSMERAIEAALQPGRFISYGASGSFVSDLVEVGSQVERLLSADSVRAAGHYETLIAGCYEKAEEIDDSGGELGMFQ
jgi:hypothetical protein